MRSSVTSRGFRSIFDKSSSYHRASVLIPFLAISAALGVLSYRSYHLSLQMEQALNSFAVHYLAYAAEVTARRTDVAVSSEMFQAASQWQETERANPSPEFDQLNMWIKQHPWIISAIYIPDDDPANSIYVTVLDGRGNHSERLTQDFITASGSVRYTYSPTTLLSRTRRRVTDQIVQEAGLPAANEVPAHSRIELVKIDHKGLKETADGYSIVVPLSAPLSTYGVRAAVLTSYANAGWGRYRIVSVWFAVIAILVAGLGVFFAIRGLRKESEAMNLRAALIANVSHELRTPLAMIRLGAETLKRGAKLTPEDRASLEDSILREVIHLNHLVENVLDVARLQRAGDRLAFTRVDPAGLVRSLLATYQSWIINRGFSLQLDLQSGLGEQTWDADSVSRAVLNLIDNAMKYSDEDKRLVVSLYQTEESVIIAVTDHGIGIHSRELSRIFEPYYRASFSDTETRRGAGLGLTLVHQIVRAHGGRIEVDSIPGVGSTFRLLFPRQIADRVEQTSPVLKPSEAS